MRARAVLVGVAGVSYIVASHWLMTRVPASSWNAVLIVGPMLLLAAWIAWQRGWRILGLIGAAVAGVLALQAWRGDGVSAGTLYVGQYVAIHFLLATVFGSTLQAGREPLITALARRVHVQLGPGMAEYTRKLTIVWTAYFVAMATVSLALYRLAPFEAWAVFANLVTPLALVVFFVGEYIVRYRLHPEFERATLTQALAAYAHRHDASP